MSDNQPRNSEKQDDTSREPAQSNERVMKLEVNHGVFVTLAQFGHQTPASAPGFSNTDYISLSGGSYTAGISEDVVNYLNKTLPIITQGDIEFYKAKKEIDAAIELKRVESQQQKAKAIRKGPVISNGDTTAIADDGSFLVGTLALSKQC